MSNAFPECVLNAVSHLACVVGPSGSESFRVLSCNRAVPTSLPSAIRTGHWMPVVPRSRRAAWPVVPSFAAFQTSG